MIHTVNAIKTLSNLISGKKEKERAKNNEQLKNIMVSVMEPFAKTVKYENDLLKESMSMLFDEVVQLSDDINDGFNSISNELNNLNLKLDFISDSIISISNDLNMISNEINILMNNDYKVGLSNLENYILTNNKMELEQAKLSFVKAHNLSLERRDYSYEDYKQYVIATMVLAATNYKYSEYHNGYKDVVIKDLNNLLKGIIEDKKENIVIDILKIYIFPFLNDNYLKPKIINNLENVYKGKVVNNLNNFDFISAKSSAFELTSLTGKNILLNNVLSLSGDIDLETDIKRKFMSKNSEYKKAFEYMQKDNFHLSKDNYFEFANNFNNEKMLKFAFKGLYGNGLYEECEEFFNKFYIPDRDYRAKAYIILHSKTGKTTELNNMKNFVLNDNNYSDDIKQLAYKL